MVSQKPAKQNINQSEKIKLQQGYHHQEGLVFLTKFL